MRRGFAAAIFVWAVAGVIVPGAASGAGATYVVVQCHPQNLDAHDAVMHEPRAYGITRGCADAASDNAMRINNRLNAERGREGLISWIAPPDTGFTRVRAEAKLRRDAGHYARIYMADEHGREVRRIATGDGSPGAFHEEIWDGTRQDQFVAALGCDEPGGCPQSDAAKSWVREVRMTLTDYADPEVDLGGELVGGSWQRGTRALTFVGTDAGSGLSELTSQVNGLNIAAGAEGDCEGSVDGTALASRLIPCLPGVPTVELELSTAAAPFHDGTNRVEVCGVDFAGNQTCRSTNVDVDNTAPAVAFTSAQASEDPELIQALVTDAHSGLDAGRILYRRVGETLWRPLDTVHDSGALRARVDSTSVPAGTYEFRATVSDVAGNQAETTRRSDGLEMRLEFPLKTGVDLTAAIEPGGARRVTVPYGKRCSAAGVLRDVSGKPIADEPVVVREFFGEGALIRERVTTVRTDERGRWRSKLPAGPSRRVTAHYAGTQRYLPESTLGGRLAVRTRASLKTSKSRVPEGGRVVFRGRLGRLGARIPPGGKLLELQVKQDSHTYQTVGQGFRSNSSGRFRVPYRFGRFYQYDVRFRFRVKVAREADWPYKAPVRSRGRTITVLDR